MGIYEIKDARPDKPVIGDEPNYHLGITYANRRPKLAFSTIKLMVRLLGPDSLTVQDSALTVEVTAGRTGHLCTHLFQRRNGARVLVVWDRTASPSVRITLPATAKRVVEYALDGTGRVDAAFNAARCAAFS